MNEELWSKAITICAYVDVWIGIIGSTGVVFLRVSSMGKRYLHTDYQ
jgi:hypothetical protein